MLCPIYFILTRLLFVLFSLLNSQSLSNLMKKVKSTNSYETIWKKFGAQASAERDLFLWESFPSGFQWATSAESFKVEGGWLEEGKGETIWDHFGHDGQTFENQTADLACDSYNKVDYDVYLLRGLQVNTYQFSISWARIFPLGQRDSQSKKGTLYYDKLINTLIESGIQPVATLYHWDLPQALQDSGGWTNESIVEAFKDYADFCFARFGDRVKTWNTFSSPWVVSHAGYGTGEHPPGIKDYAVSFYQVKYCSHYKWTSNKCLFSYLLTGSIRLLIIFTSSGHSQFAQVPCRSLACLQRQVQKLTGRKSRHCTEL